MEDLVLPNVSDCAVSSKSIANAAAPLLRAYSLIPRTLLWFSIVYMKVLSLLQGKASPTSLRAAVAPEVKIHLYSFGDALQILRTYK